MSLQHTIAKPVQVKGIGVHSGQSVLLTIHPAEPDAGIVFIRSDLPGNPRIEANFKNVFSTQMATTLSSNKVRLGTVEHLMAALYGMGIDNAYVEVGGPEVPILDGSSIGFVEAIQSVGIEAQLKAKKVIHLKKKVQLRVDDKWAVALPSDGFEVKTSIEWDHPVIGFQEFTYKRGITQFSELANARTFGFLSDVQALKKIGLAQGGSLQNAIVLDEAKVLNSDGLRYADEFARHKVLDAIGDFKLAGYDFKGSFRLHRPGHELHYRLLMAIFSDTANFEIESMKSDSKQAVTEEMLAALANASRVAAV